MNKQIFMIFGILLLLPVVLAEETEYDYEDIEAFMDDIPSLNEQLSSGEVQLPDSAGYILKSGNVYVNVEMNDGSSKEFYFSVEEKKITGVSEGKPEEINYIIETNEEASKKVLGSEDKVGSIMQAYENKEVDVKANGTWNKVKLFFAKILLKFA